MKVLKCVLVLFAFVGLTLVGCSDESQSPVSPVDQGTLQKNILHYVNSMNQPLVPPEGGEIRMIPGGKIQFKKLKVMEYVSSMDLDGNPDPLFTGIMEHYLSTMIDGKTGEGPVHGSFTIVPNGNAAGENAKWVGTYAGYRSYNGKTMVHFPDGLLRPDLVDGAYDNWTLNLRLEGHGKGGQLMDGKCLQKVL